ncbi:hypothetical protein [Microbacterium esteraromaticum]|uniref:hypothetical protein n=1 Tax=Microbacterium esteraromaticum TaxID=57043 RepID=UPI0019D35E1A|nr:hypothetical protein [Microbacterium esteraromaticum]MBN7793388.1 hypothetical protein [Microbacterium esteraromaticum]
MTTTDEHTPMTTLDDLFPDGPRQMAAPVVDDHHTVRRLDAMFGDRRADLDRTHRTSARPALVAMVDGAVADARPLGEVPPVSRPDGRRRRRFDAISVVAGGLAAAALVVTGAIGAVQLATASPADDALSALAADEKTIDSAMAGLESAHARLAESISEADATAAALPAELQQVREATDPADIPPGWTEVPDDAGVIAIADPAALDAVLAAVESYRTDLAAVELPEVPAVYARADIDADSLDEVAAAIDAAQLQLAQIDRTTAALRETRMAVDARTAQFEAELAVFTATFPGLAQTVVEQNPDAEPELAAAVVAAGQEVARADLLAAQGTAVLVTYREAVVALVESQVYADRVRLEQEQREEEERQRQQEQQPQPEVSPDPVEPEPGPENPPVDPSPDPVEPTAPPEGEVSG